MQVTDLVRYSHIVRELYFDSMAKLPWAEVVKPRGLSFDSMRNVFLHLTLVEDRWVNFIIPGHFNQWKDPNFDDINNFSQLKKYIQYVKHETEGYSANISLKELSRQIIIPWGDKPDTRISIETALTHMVMEDMIHYGELSALMWQMNLDAPYMGFW
jgi:uncharacterized damage-inducible protein DinB